MAIEVRKTGISVVGDMPWGTHFCSFHETTQDLLDTWAPYAKAGLENNEFCLWVISDLLPEEEARSTLQQAVPDLDHYLAESSMEILTHEEWYLKGGSSDTASVPTTALGRFASRRSCPCAFPLSCLSRRAFSSRA